MARTSATISVGADTRQLERDIQSALSRDFKFKGFNEKVFTQPLGRITGAANEFQKSLDASNARVIAFGASAGLIYTVEKAFSSLVKSTIDVQKSLTDINVILNVNATTLNKFGNSLFEVAKNTAQSFDSVAQAATEFSRQGLGIEETLKRTRDALILTRLSGLDTVSAVEALTATINSFNDTALDSTTIINKLANVDAAFAVSSGDLADAVKRVGSSAQDAGVGFDELLAIVTSVQQTTARGGAVIGNSLKTIFTRIQRTDTLDQLEQLGIQVKDLEGRTLPAVQILNNLSTTFDTLGDSQRAQIAETVGGVFQINILKAALGDLNKEYSVYSRALETARDATDQAITRNEALNQTLSSLINKTFVNLTKLGSDIGKISFQPTFENLLGLLNKGLESLSTDSEGLGGKIGRGIFEGIGAFISGPGVILLTAVFGKLFLNLGKFASESLRTLLTINTQAEQRAQIEAKISQVLAQEPALVAAIYNKQISVLDVEEKILGIIRQQTLERERAASISTTIAGGLIGRGVTTKGGTLKAKSGGFIPNFSASEIYGALAGGYMPGNIRNMNIPGQGNITYNTAETVKNFPGMSQPAIMPPEQSKAGKNYQKQFSKTHGFDPYASSGFIPNFASYNINGQYFKNASAVANAIFKGKITKEAAAKAGYISSTEQKALAQKEKLNAPYYESPSTLLALRREGLADGYTFKPKGKPPLKIQFPIATFNRNSIGFDLSNLETNLDKVIDQSIKEFADSIYKTKKVTPPIDLPSTIEAAKQRSEGLAGAVQGTIGGIFEAAFRAAFGKSVKATKGGGFDVQSMPESLPLFFPGALPGQKGDFKNSDSSDNRKSMAFKILKYERPDLLKYVNTQNAAAGFIPNFTALDNAISREIASGTSTSKIRVGKDARLTSSANPLGLGVYNTKDEPFGLGQGIQRYGSKAKIAGAANGFIPNFANMPIASPMGPIGAIKNEMALTQAVNAMTKNTKIVSITTEKLGKNLDNLNGKFLALSIGLPILVSTISQFIEDTPTSRGITNLLNNTSTFGFMGAMMGKTRGGIAGTAIGLGITAYQWIKDIEDTDIKAQIKQMEDLKQQFSDTQTGLQQLIPQLEEYRRIQFSNMDEISKTEALKQLRENVLNTLNKLPEEATEKILDAFNQGDLDKIPYLLNEALFKRSAEIIQKESKLYFDAIAKEGVKPGEESKVARALLGGKSATTGKSFISTFMEAEGGKEKIQDITQRLESISADREAALKESILLMNARNEALKREGLDPFSEAGYAAPKSLTEPSWENLKKDMSFMTRDIVMGTQMGGMDYLVGKGLSPEQTAKKFQELNNSLDDVIDAVKPIYDATEEGRKWFEETTAKAKEGTLTLDQEDKIIQAIVEDLRKRLAIGKKINKKQEDIVRNLQDFEDFYASGKLTEQMIRDFGVRLDKSKEFNPANMMGRQYGALYQGIRSEVVNPAQRAILSEKLTMGEQDLKRQLDQRLIDEDQYLIALKALQESTILLSKRNRGQLFAEDFRSARQKSREDKILSNQTQLMDFPQAFFDEFDYKTQDAYRDAQLGAIETARTIKSEFNNAFLSFANGTETASDAFTRMASNISDKIQQLALEFATNQIFGALFGSTSNIFGGSGVGDFFSSLFKKSKGGLIRGYSSGGTVTGGSGTKDDIPAMLSAGEYVIKKSAVNKYGLGLLDMLNNRKVSKFAYGGGASFIEQNTYENDYDPIYIPETGQTIYMPKNGRISAPELSIRAILDPTNPQNEARNEAERRYYDKIRGVQDYLAYVDNVRKANEEAYAENQRLNKEIRDQYNKQKSAASRGAWMSFGLGLLGAGASQFSSMGGFSQFGKQASSAVNLRPAYKSPYEGQTLWSPSDSTGRLKFGKSLGGEVKKFASGGSSKDDIPALLMGGEFIMRKEAVNLYGKRFFDNLNAGRIKKFAQGGEVDNSFSNPKQLESFSPTNNVNITVNLNDSAGTKNNQMNNEKSENKEQIYSDAKSLKDLGIKIRNEVMKVITEQQRPGGLLRR